MQDAHCPGVLQSANSSSLNFDSLFISQRAFHYHSSHHTSVSFLKKVKGLGRTQGQAKRKEKKTVLFIANGKIFDENTYSVTL